MRRKIAVGTIENWITENEPNGKEKLAIKSSLSLSIIDKILRSKYASEPNPSTMKALCRALDKSMDELFPPEKYK